MLLSQYECCESNYIGVMCIFLRLSLSTPISLLFCSIQIFWFTFSFPKMQIYKKIIATLIQCVELYILIENSVWKFGDSTCWLVYYASDFDVCKFLDNALFYTILRVVANKFFLFSEEFISVSMSACFKFSFVYMSRQNDCQPVFVSKAGSL